MYTVDLLKGRGVPEKIKPANMAMLTATVALPVLAAIVMFGFYISNTINIRVRTAEVDQYEKMIDKYSDTLKRKEKILASEKKALETITQINQHIEGFMQWTPVLVELAGKTPESMLITELSADSEKILKTTKVQDGKITRQVNLEIPARSLHLKIRGKGPGDYLDQVKSFSADLADSPVFENRIEEVRISQQTEKQRKQELELTNVSRKYVDNEVGVYRITLRFEPFMK